MIKTAKPTKKKAGSVVYDYLDCPEGVAFAQSAFPPTACAFKTRTGACYVYRCPDKVRDLPRHLRDPITGASKAEIRTTPREVQ